MHSDTAPLIPINVNSVVVDSVRQGLSCTYFLMPAEARDYSRFDPRERRTLHSCVQIAILRCIANDHTCGRQQELHYPTRKDMPVRHDDTNIVQVRARACEGRASMALFDYLDNLVWHQLRAYGWTPQLIVVTA